jgi:hypothetical protein
MEELNVLTNGGKRMTDGKSKSKPERKLDIRNCVAMPRVRVGLIVKSISELP